jgi:glycosyltransferase involved in cell wall biosynthesis
MPQASQAGNPSGATRPETLIVVPCYNEALRLPSDVFDAFLDAEPRVGFLLVDDGSRDGTLELMRAIAGRQREGRVEVLELHMNQGKAEAVRLGLIRAITHGCTYTGFWDADLATPLDAIVEFRELLKQRPDLDWVIGARVKLLGRRIDRQAARHYLGRVFATAASIALGIPVYDTQCGAKLFRCNSALESVLRERFGSRWVFDVELIGRYLNVWRARGEAHPEMRIFEYPLHAWSHIGDSKIGPGDFFRSFVELALITLRLRRERHLVRS